MLENFFLFAFYLHYKKIHFFPETNKLNDATLLRPICDSAHKTAAASHVESFTSRKTENLPRLYEPVGLDAIVNIKITRSLLMTR